MATHGDTALALLDDPVAYDAKLTGYVQQRAQT